MGKVYKEYRKKVLVSRKDGAVIRTIFCINASNKLLRTEADLQTTAKIKKIIIDEDHDFLATYYTDEI